MKYTDIRSKLKTGDVVLFSGTSAFSVLIKLITKCKFSHSAVVVRDGDRVNIFEAVDKGVGVNSLDGWYVQEARMSQRIAERKGFYAIRPILGPRTEGMLQAFTQFRKEVDGRPYEQNMFNLAKPALADLGITGDVDDLSSMFCSECVAASLQHMGILPTLTGSTWYSPRHFSEQDSLKLNPGWTWGAQIEIDN